MAAKKRPAPKGKTTYAGEALAVLVYEFSDSEHAASERKLKRRLREKKLGDYDQARIDLLRAFKDDVQRELHSGRQSRFYAGPHGPYADMGDWLFDDLMRHFVRRHPAVPKRDMGAFLPFAIYCYYLR